MIVVVVMMGGRLTQIEPLTWGDLVFTNWQSHIRGSKADRSGRIISMDRELGELLAQMRDGREDQNPQDQPIGDGGAASLDRSDDLRSSWPVETVVAKYTLENFAKISDHTLS